MTIEERPILINPEMAYSGFADWLMPLHAKERKLESRARTAAAAADFLRPDWSNTKLHDVMTAREAVALFSGINRSCAWVIDHDVGDGEARKAILAARALLPYIRVAHGILPASEVVLKRIVEVARETGDLQAPVGFPGAGHALGALGEVGHSNGRGETRNERADRRLRELERLGGSAEVRHGRCRFTGIGKLVKAEKARGSVGADDKTIRSDLEAAADRRHMADREVAGGWPEGLGSRR